MRRILVVIFSCVLCGLLCSCSMPEFGFELNEDGNSYTLTYYNELSDAKSEVIIPENYEGLPVTIIGGSAFANHDELERIVIPEGVEIIDSNAFGGCSSLKEIEIPSSTYLVSTSAFEGCTSLTEIYLPQAVAIDRDAFKGCSGLKKVDLGSETTKDMVYTSYDWEKTFSIGYDAFKNCSGLEIIKIGPCYAVIEEGAFSYCENLTEIYLTNGLKTIETCAFEYCEGLQSLYFEGTPEEWLNVEREPWWIKDAGEYTEHIMSGDGK